MRVDLIAQAAQLGCFGGAAVFALAPFSGAGLFGIDHRKIQRRPGEQQEIAPNRDVGQLPPQALFGEFGLQLGELRAG